MKFYSLFLRPFSSYGVYRWYCSSSVPTLSTVKRDPTSTVDARLVGKINHILKEANLIEPELELLAHKLSPRLVSFVLQNPPSPQLGFRFFIWAARRRWLKTWQLHRLILDTLLGEGEEGGLNLYWKTLEELRDSKVPVPSDAFLVLFLGCWEIGLPEKAVEAFGQMRLFGSEPNVYAYNGILHLLVQRDVIMLALAVFNQMGKSNCSPNLASYSMLMDGLCKIGQTQDALKLFDEMAQRSISPNNITYSIVFSALCQANRADDAALLFNKLASGSDGCSPDNITCNALLNGFCKLGRMDEAFLLLKRFQPYAYTLGIKGYSCIIEGLFRAGRFEEANGWFKKLCLENVKPDVQLYTIMIHGYSKVGRVEEAVHFLEDMTWRGLVPDVQCYNALIRGYCKLGFFNHAKSLKDEMSGKGCHPDAYTYTILISALGDKGQIEMAKCEFEEMQKRGCIPSVVTFNAFIDALSKVGDLDAASKQFIYMGMGNSVVWPVALSQGPNRVVDSASLQRLVQQWCNEGLYLKAYKMLTKAIGNVVPNLITYNTLINHMCKAGRIDTALMLLKDLKQKGLSPDSFTYGTLIDGLCRVGREEDAIRRFDQFTQNETSPSSSLYKSLMTWLSRSGKVSMTFTLWLKYLRSHRDREEETLNSISEHLQGGEVVKAVEELLQLDFRLKQFDLGPYTIWIIGLCQAKRTKEALEIFHYLVDHRVDVTAPSCVMLIRSLCKEGKLDQAMDVFLYTLWKRMKLKRRVCDYLLNSVLHSDSARTYVIDLIRRMESAGYDLDACVNPATKLLLEEYYNSSNLSGSLTMI